MTPRTTIPAEITQAAENASSAAKRAAVALNRSATAEGMVVARQNLERSWQDLATAIVRLDSIMSASTPGFAV